MVSLHLDFTYQEAGSIDIFFIQIIYVVLLQTFLAAAFQSLHDLIIAQEKLASIGYALRESRM